MCDITNQINNVDIEGNYESTPHKKRKIDVWIDTLLTFPKTTLAKRFVNTYNGFKFVQIG